MKKLISVFFMLTAAALLSAQSKNNADLFAFDSVDLDGNKITSTLYSENKVTMINIWGTFCGPCIREMPDLAKLSSDYKSRGLEIIGIPIDITNEYGKIMPAAKADALMILNQTGVKYKNVVPTIDMFRGFLRGVQAVPTTIFVDKNGRQLGNVYMGSRSYKDWQKIIDKLLKDAE